MFMPLAALVLVLCTELLVLQRRVWNLRRWLLPPLGLLSLGLVLWVCVAFPGILSLCIAAVTLYGLFNMARAVWGKATEAYLQRTVPITARWLIAVRLGLAYVLLCTWYVAIPFSTYVTVLAGVQLLVAVGVWLNTRRQLRVSRVVAPVSDLSDNALPTITIAVPVRNEAPQLFDGLTSILATNYPKLEVLTFDDRSTDATPEVIRQFAHGGVRFLRSVDAPQGWLAKNWAYEQLTREASGEYILFCGADVRFDAHAVRQLLALAAKRDKAMVTVLPQNKVVTRLPLLQAMRYYWELSPPRRFFHRPPVLSSCWLVRRQALAQAGGFASVRRAMSPESHLARAIAAQRDGYSFVVSTGQLGVWSEKTITEQQETAIFRRYPQMHRRPELVLTFAVGQTLLLLALPIIILLPGVSWYARVVTLVAFIVHSAAFGMVQHVVFERVSDYRAYAALLPCIATDIWYMHVSMFRYEFGSVSWKGRNVAPAIMLGHGDTHRYE